MKQLETDPLKGIWALPSFPVVLVTAGAFHFYSFEPACVMVGIMSDKYSYQVVKKLNCFGINIPRADQVELVRFCGSVSGRDVEDKYAAAAVTPVRAAEIDGYLIQECPVNLECQVVHVVDYPGSHHWFVGEIRAVHLDEFYDRGDALMFWSGQYRRVGEFLAKA